MSPEVALLHEVWDSVKSYIPTKERTEIAEQLVRKFDEVLDIADITVYKNEFDKVMKVAIISYFGEPDADDEDDDNGW